MASEGTGKSPPAVPHLGESGYFCIGLFCGSGNLTYAMKHFFPDSFVDHKVGKQRVKTVWILVWKQINGWSKNGASRGVVCGCTGAFRAGQPREHGSEGCPRHMDHPHFEATGGQMEFHHCVKFIHTKIPWNLENLNSTRNPQVR